MPSRRWWFAAAVATYLAVRAVNRSLVDVRGPSMEPHLVAGDRLLTVPAVAAWLRPGQVVVATDPADPAHLVVKRIARRDRDAVVLLGDHPAASTDSRRWGPVPTSTIRRVALRRWPDLRTPLVR